MLRDFSKVPSQAKILVVGTVFSQLGIGLVLTDLAYFLTSIRGLPATFSGLVFTVEGLTSVALSLPLGVMSDRYGRKRFVLAGNIFVGVSILLISLFSNELIIVLAGAMAGISEAAFTSSTGALLAQYSNSENRTAIFSLAALAGNLAWGAGGFLLYLIEPLERIGLDPLSSHLILYISLAASTFLSTLLLVRLNETKRDWKRTAGYGILSPATRKILIKYIGVNIFVAFGAGLVVPLMSQWFAYKYGVPDSVSGPVLGVSNVLIAAASLAAPAAARKLGVVRSIVLTETASTLFMFLTPLPSTFALSGTIYVIRAFLMNVSNPLSSSLIMGMVPDEERGAASGISATFWRMPNAISTYPGAAMMRAGYLNLPFYIASALYVMSIALFWKWFKGSEEGKRDY
ncbi:MAG: MFS transporter [Conexivisphaerales archaeon]